MKKIMMIFLLVISSYSAEKHIKFKNLEIIQYRLTSDMRIICLNKVAYYFKPADYITPVMNYRNLKPYRCEKDYVIIEGDK